MNLRHKLELSLALEQLRLAAADINERLAEIEEILLRACDDNSTGGDNVQGLSDRQRDNTGGGCDCGAVGVVRFDSMRISPVERRVIRNRGHFGGQDE